MSRISTEVALGPQVPHAPPPPPPPGLISASATTSSRPEAQLPPHSQVQSQSQPQSRTSTSRDPSRPGSRSRRSSPSKPRLRNVNPNDARFKAPSTEVINDLLASIPDITFPDPLQPSPSLRSPASLTPVQRSRQPSVSATPRLSSSSPNRALPNATHDFYDYPPPIQESAEPPPEGDAAEAPVVRTSRPPSGFSKSAQPQKFPLKSRQRNGMVSPQILLSPPPEPENAPPPKPLYDSNNVPTGYKSPGIKRAARRDSLDSTRSRESFQHRVLRLTSRSRPPAGIYSPSRVSLRSEANDAQRAGKVTSGAQTPLYRSIPPSGRPSQDQGERPLYNKSNHSPAPLSRSTSGSPLRNESSSSRPLDPLVSQPSDGVISSRPPASSSLFKQQKQTVLLPVDQTATQVTVNGTTNKSQNVDSSLNSEDHEANVLRRIKELKAAKEERRKSVEQASYLPSSPEPTRTTNGASSPVQGSQPDTTMASKQLIEAANVEENEVPIDLDQGQGLRSREPSVALNGDSNLSTTEQREKTGDSANLAAPIRSQELTSEEYSDVGYSSPRRKRWSPLNLPSAAPASPKPEHRRNRNSVSRQPAVVEDRRPSMDVINASVRDFLASPRLSQNILFPADGRSITFSEVGDPNGSVVFCCVGMGLTRYITTYYDELATSLKLRLITPDRPGKGDSAPYPSNAISPLDWPDDIKAICANLGISKFSLLAHSAGTIYALATALRMPGLVRGKIHLLAPWIPQSQFESRQDLQNTEAPFNATLTRSQRFLRILPTSLLKLSNSSITGINRTNSPKAAQGKGRKSQDVGYRPTMNGTPNFSVPASKANTRPVSPHLEDLVEIPSMPAQDMTSAVLSVGTPTQDSEKERQRLYDEALTPAIWEMATRNGNPAVDLIVCLERSGPIGFRYTDVGSKPIGLGVNSKPDSIGHQWPGHGVVIHHGSKDSRVPIENVKWLGRNMTNAEVRILEGQGHGLMSTAGVMGSVLTEIGKDWETHTW